jgi:hypothetical protein
MEDAMKLSATLLSAVLAGAVVCALPAYAQEKMQDKDAKPAAEKETKMQGTVVRIYTDSKTMDIRGGASAEAKDMRKIAYDDKTQWTNMGKAGKMEEVKEGSFVIVLGHLEKDGALHATRIDLRLPR